MTELWPRLGLAPATVAYRALEGEPAQLAVAARTKHPQMTYAATGGRRIGETGVRQLADAVRATPRTSGIRTRSTPLIWFGSTVWRRRPCTRR